MPEPTRLLAQLASTLPLRRRVRGGNIVFVKNVDGQLSNLPSERPRQFLGTAEEPSGFPTPSTNLTKTMVNFVPEPGTILVADEELRVLEMLRSVLEEAGYRVLLVEDGKQAQVVLQEVRVDVLIASLSLPEVNGRELAHWVRQTFAEAERSLIFVVGNLSNIAEPNSPFDLDLPRPPHPSEILTFLKRLL